VAAERDLINVKAIRVVLNKQCTADDYQQCDNRSSLERITALRLERPNDKDNQHQQCRQHMSAANHRTSRGGIGRPARLPTILQPQVIAEYWSWCHTYRPSLADPLVAPGPGLPNQWRMVNGRLRWSISAGPARIRLSSVQDGQRDKRRSQAPHHLY